MARVADQREVLVVDDEPAIRTMMTGYLEAEGYRARVAADGAEAIRLVGEQLPDLVILDLRMPGMNGLDVLARIKEIDRRIAVVLMSGYATVETAVRAMKLGAETVLAKPVGLAELGRALDDALAQRQDLAGEQEGAKATGSLRDLMGPSDAIARVCELVEQVAATDLTVILHGETGAGKSLVARAIHAASPRAARRLVRVDCGAIPDTLIESELFGHERGAFTGAVARNQGYFEMAHGGTLFLDEIGNLSEAMMRKLLCALEERRFYRVGGKEPIDVDIRVVAASNRNLPQLVEQGSFRRDLFHRLNEFVIEIPPLRQRRDDIPFLAQRFLDMANAELRRDVRGFSPEATEALLAYEWSGNVRELRNVIKRAVLLSNGTIGAEALCAAGSNGAPAPRPAPAAVAPDPELERVLEGQWSLKDIARETVRQVERQVITCVLAHTGGNRSQAARILNVDYKTLYYKARKLAAEEEGEPVGGASAR
ncbi:MAG TPA: sigma-54 dependent transcriptional regulator [Planctomycetota bacterium]|nr:sigma-54 dependent transcriptional regulator [Planctomycetota bacterium]